MQDLYIYIYISSTVVCKSGLQAGLEQGEPAYYAALITATLIPT